MLEKNIENIDLPETLIHWGKNDFEEIFLNELQENEAKLPLGKMCYEGGWPVNDSLKLSIESRTEQEGKVIIRVCCFFNVVIPTGCSDIKNSSSGNGVVKVVLIPNENRAYLYDYDDATKVA